MTNLHLIFFLLALLVILSFLLFSRSTYDIIDYKITSYGIDIVFFTMIPLMRISFNNIKEIRKVSVKETMSTKDPEMFMALRIGNRMFGEIVLVRKNKGIIRAVLITPVNPERFIQKVRDSLL